jgi:hypothetical protein
MVDIDSRVHGISGEEKDGVVLLISNVLKRISKEDRVLLLDRRCVHFILPINSTAEGVFINPLINTDPRYTPMVPLWLVSLRTDLLTEPMEQQIYTIVHELAHVFHEHGLPGKGHDPRESEIQADQKVMEWGFGEELQKTPYNYLQGDGFESWRR